MSSLKGVDRLLRSRHCGGLVLFDITSVSYHSLPFSPLFFSVMCYSWGVVCLSCVHIILKFDFLFGRERVSPFQATHFGCSVSQAYHKESSSLFVGFSESVITNY